MLKVLVGRPLAAKLGTGAIPLLLTTLFLLWHRAHTPLAILAPRVALIAAILGLALILAGGVAQTLSRGSKELQGELRQLELCVRQCSCELEQAREQLVAETRLRKLLEKDLGGLSGQVLLVQEQERRRIARDLHDSTAQSLAAISINLERAHFLAENHDNPDLSSVLLDSRDLLEQITLEIRTLSYLLHPPILDELGLQQALPRYVEGFSRRSGIAIDLRVQDDLGRMPPDLELTLFRIIQEALTNIHRHSGSRTARISVFRESESAVLEVKDEGSGIPLELVESTRGNTSRLGVGIEGMQQRVQQLGGRLEINARPDGTQIRAILPIADLSASNSANSPSVIPPRTPIIRPEVA